MRSFGTSNLLVMGPEATAAIMTATIVAPLAGNDPARYAALAAMTAILVGVLALLAHVARLGFITDFLSKPILVGYIFGTTLIVIGSQLGKMFGIKLESDKFFQQIVELISRLDEAHLLTVAIGVVCMATLFIIRRLNRKLPGPLIVVVGAILVSALFDLQAKGVAVVGGVPPGLPRLAIPAVNFQDILSLLPGALALTILVYADEILTARVFAAKHGQKVDADQEFVAIGMADHQRWFLDRISRRDEQLAHRGRRPDGWQIAVVRTHRRCAYSRLPALLHAAAGAAAHRRAGRHYHRRFGWPARRGGLSLLTPRAPRRVLAGGCDNDGRADRRHPARHSRGGDAVADQRHLSHFAPSRRALG